MASRAYSSGKFAMTLADSPVGFVASVEGGEPFGEVVAEAPVGGKVGKHIGNIAFAPIVVEVGAAMAKPFLDWINACLEGRADRRTVPSASSITGWRSGPASSGRPG